MSNRKIMNIHDDEIDFHDVWVILSRYKYFILIFTFIITLGCFIYTIVKNPVPIYTGSIMIEIGEVKSDNYAHAYLDNAYNLKTVLEKEFAVTVTMPEVYNRLVGEKSMNDILIINVNNEDKSLIKPFLLKVKDFIIKRHQEKSKLFDDYIMSQQIGNVEIEDKPINALNQKLIVFVSFIIGLIVSMFIVVFLEYLNKGHL